MDAGAFIGNRDGTQQRQKDYRESFIIKTEHKEML